MKRLIFAALASVAMLVGLAGPAAASDYKAYNQAGGTVVNSVNSDMSIKISSTTYTMYLPIGASSRSWSNFQDTDAFYVPAGAVARNVNTGYGYDGGTSGRWFYLASDSVYIALNIYYY